MLLQRNINAFSISLTDRGLRMDGDGVGNRTKPSSVSVNDFYQELRNYRILLFWRMGQIAWFSEHVMSL